MIDYGFPQITESKILQELVDAIAKFYIILSPKYVPNIPINDSRYITQEGCSLTSHQVKPPMAVTNAVSWRSDGIFYRKNEVFIDVIESVNLLVCKHTE